MTYFNSPKTPRATTGAAYRPGGIGQVQLNSSERADLTQKYFSAGVAEREKRREANESRDYNFLTHAAAWTAATAVNFADDLWSNRLNPLAETEDDIWNMIDSSGSIGEEFHDYFRQHEGGISATSGVAGAVGVGWLTGAKLLPLIGARLAGSTAITGSKLWQAGARFNAATRANVMNANLAAARNQGYVRAWNSLPHVRLAASKVGKWAGVAAAEEAAILATMNANDLIFDPDDIADSMFWATVGVGIGAGIGAVRGRSILRDMANDPLVIAERAAAQDPVGITRKFQASGDLPLNITNPAPAPGASATRFALEAFQSDAGMSSGLASRIDSARTGAMDALNFDLRKLKFDKKQAEAWAKKDGVLAKDPLTLHGLEEIKPSNGAKWVTQLEETIAKAQVGKATKQEAQLASDKLSRVMIHVDGAWHSRSANDQLTRLVEDSTPINATLRNNTPGIATEFDVRLPGAKEIQEIRISNRPIPASKRNFNKLDVKQAILAADAFKQFSKKIDKAKQPYRIRPIADSSWMQYDAALYRNRVEGKNLSFSADAEKAGIKNTDDLELASFRAKAEAILASKDTLQTTSDFIKWNLPTPTYTELAGSNPGQNMRTLLQAAKDGATLDELKTLRREMNEIAGYQKQGLDNSELTGNLFSFNRDAEGNWIKPVYATFSKGSRTQINHVQDAVTDEMVRNRLSTVSTLLAPGKNGRARPAVSTFAESLLKNPEMAKASKILGQADDQVTGLGNEVSQILGSTRTMEFRARANETLSSLVKTVEAKEKYTDSWLVDLTTRHMGDVMSRITGPGARDSRELLHNFHAYSGGWDLAEDLVTVNHNGKKLFGFQLENTTRNRERLGISKESVKGQKVIGNLTNPRTGADILLDSDGLDFQLRFNSLSNELLENQNRLREARNIRPIGKKNWYVPPRQNLANAIIGWVYDANGEIVKNRAVIASSPEEYAQLSNALQRELDQTMPGARIRTKDDVAAYKDIFDDAEMDWIDPSHLAAPSRANKGTLSSEFVNPNSIRDSMRWVQKQVESIGTSTLRTLLDDSIRTARVRHNVEVAVGSATREGRTIYQEYEALARGIPLSRLESAQTGKTATQLENLGNSMIQNVWPNVAGLAPRQAARWTHDLVDRMGVPSNKVQKILSKASSYKNLAEALGPYSPYRDFDDYLTQRLGHKPPPEVKDLTQKFNTISASLVLRALELPHAAMNLAGLIVTMPAIVRSGRSPFHRIPVTGTRDSVPLIDTAKILSAAVGDMVAKRGTKDWDIMVKNGDASQQVAELHKIFSLLTGNSGFKRVFFGTGTKGGKKGIAGLFNEKGIDGLISVLTDSTENFSRQYAHFVGLRLADMHGITSDAARHSFARDIANAGIANYSSVNRPELFQTPLGSLFGLFTSWARAYNQRLFRWLEDGEFARVAEQYAIQSALFGTRSNAGHDSLEWLFNGGGRDSEGQEVPTLTDRIYARFGPVAGAAIANGGIAAVTGLALWSRGDTNIRVPSLNPIDNAASLSVLGKLGSMALDVGKYGLHKEAVLESIGRNLPNRVLKGAWTELVNEGQEIDSAGRIITESQTLGDSIARYIGVRSARQQQEAELYYSNSAAMRDDAARMETLRLKTRAAFRKDGITDEEVMDAFNEYLELGGNPGNFQTWIRSQVREATTARSQKQLRRLLNNPNNHLKLWRYDTYMKGLH